MTSVRNPRYDLRMTRNADPNLNVSVADADARYSGSNVGMTVDAGVQGTTVHPEDDALGSDHGHHGATELLPELRNAVRSADDVERERQSDRPTRSPWVLPVVVGVGTFLLMLAASPIVIWFALSSSEPTVKPPPPQQDELMGIPVRRGLK